MTENIPLSTNIQFATFGGGCFWGIELRFAQLSGVLRTRVGYAGGKRPNPTYHQVCSGATNHAEVVEVTFDPQRITYEQLLNTFWQLHDPTQLNRQGVDIGTQYRSVIFCHDETQILLAQESKKLIQNAFSKPIVTQILPAETFWEAETYHQQYLAKRGLNACGY